MPYTAEYKLYRHDGDFRGMAKPGALLRYSQQIATEHAQALGLTDELYARTHTAYVLAKQALHIVRTPRVDETITLKTEPEALRRAVNRRFTTFVDAQGREVACTDARWVLIDTEKRMILRKHPEEFPTKDWPETVERELPIKIKKANREDCEQLGSHRADYSRCDMNGHMNNTVYADLICDALPPEIWHTQMVTDLIIYYHKEVAFGESTCLYRSQLQNDHWYIGGWQGDTCNFEAEVTLAPMQSDT